MDGISLPTDPSAYVSSDQGTVLGFNQESDAFTTWLGNSSLYSYLNTSVATPYLNEMGFGK